MTIETKPEAKRIKSVAKAMAVLRLFGHGDDLSLAEIATSMTANASSIYHLVQTLVDERMLRQDPVTRRYSLGPGLLSISPPSLRTSTLVSAAEGPIYEVARITGFDVWIAILESDRVYYIARVDGVNPLKVHMPLLRLQPAYCVAAGRVLLSNYTRDRARTILSQHTIRRMTPATNMDLESILDAIDLARENGFAEAEDEHIEGASDIAVPIRGDGGVVVAAVSIGAPSHVFGSEVRKGVLPVMQQAALAIEAGLAE